MTPKARQEALEAKIFERLKTERVPLSFFDIWRAIDTDDESRADVRGALDRLFIAGKIDKIAHIQPTTDGETTFLYWIVRQNKLVVDREVKEI